jgi:hypothetical protein
MDDTLRPTQTTGMNKSRYSPASTVTAPGAKPFTSALRAIGMRFEDTI